MIQIMFLSHPVSNVSHKQIGTEITKSSHMNVTVNWRVIAIYRLSLSATIHPQCKCIFYNSCYQLLFDLCCIKMEMKEYGQPWQFDQKTAKVNFPVVTTVGIKVALRGAIHSRQSSTKDQTSRWSNVCHSCVISGSHGFKSRPWNRLSWTRPI